MFSYSTTFDFEVFFSPDNLRHTILQHANYTTEHVPLSVSMASNVDGYMEPQCFVSQGNPQELVDSIVQYLEYTSDYAYALLCEKFEDVFHQLEKIVCS